MKKIMIAVLAGFISMSIGAYAGEMKDDTKKSDTGMTKSGKGMDKKGEAMAKDDDKSDKKKAKKKDEMTK
jgi:hypothetical protein